MVVTAGKGKCDTACKHAVLYSLMFSQHQAIIRAACNQRPPSTRKYQHETLRRTMIHRSSSLRLTRLLTTSGYVAGSSLQSTNIAKSG